MSAQRVATQSELHKAWPDRKLVSECLKGNDEAWSALIDKYKRLIYSIPVKYGFSPDESTDIFQAVCLELLSELPKLRKPEALPKWIMQVTGHKCYHAKREKFRTESTDPADPAFEQSIPAQAERVLREAESEQKLRDALGKLPDRCQELIRMLFFEEPALPYDQVARRLGIATGSIGFIRQRCLERARRELAKAGFS